MADQRVHPITIPPPPNDSGDHLNPPPATYIVQLPKEQILRYPPPENARKFQSLTRRSKNRRTCCCFTLSLLVLLLVAAAISAGVLYLVFRFKSPKYSVTNLGIKGINLTSPAPVSPGFNVTIRSENPNGKVGIDYLKGSSVSVFYDGVKLSNGVLPAFYQPRKNVTVVHTTLTGSRVLMGGAVKTSLRNAQNQGRIPFVVKTKMPVKIKVGSIKTWEITVKVKCDVVVNALTETAKIVSKDCDYSVRLW